MSKANYIKTFTIFLQSYFTVGRLKFANHVVKQAVDHFLVKGPQTLLAPFPPMFVTRLKTKEMENIAAKARRLKR